MISIHLSTATQVQNTGMEKALFQVEAPRENPSMPATRSFGSDSTGRSLKTAPGPRSPGRRVFMAFRQLQLPYSFLLIRCTVSSLGHVLALGGFDLIVVRSKWDNAPEVHEIRVAAILGNKSPLYRHGSDIHSWAGLRLTMCP